MVFLCVKTCLLFWYKKEFLDVCMYGNSRLILIGNKFIKKTLIESIVISYELYYIGIIVVLKGGNGSCYK